MSTTSYARKPVQPVRYVVQYWEDQPYVSYNCGLGTTNARRWAIDNAARYGGQVLCEYSDGGVDCIRPYGGSFGSPVLPSAAPELAAGPV